jgi:spore germination protein YaaH
MRSDRHRARRQHVRRAGDGPMRRTKAGLLIVACFVLGLGAISVLGGDGDRTVRGGVATIVPATSTDVAAPTPVATTRPRPGHETYGFLPYWEFDAGIRDHLAATDLTTLALFSVTHDRKGAMATGQQGYKRIVGERGQRIIGEAQDRGTRVEIVYSSFGAEKNRAFYENEAAQARWIEVLVAFAVEHRLDGINVDVEGLPAELIPAYGAWVERLREALRAALPDGEVSVATQANERGAAMALAASVAGADRIFIMGYDYRWTGSEPGASAPLDRIDGGTKDLVWTLDLYESLGVPVDRTILGLPLYGVTWPVLGPQFGAPARGRGNQWVPRKNLRVFAADGFEPQYDEIESVEFYSIPEEGFAPPEPGSSAENEPGRWHAVYFDSPRSLRPKLMLADERGLAGAGFWAIGYERGLPGYTELIAAFRAGEIAAGE